MAGGGGAAGGWRRPGGPIDDGGAAAVWAGSDSDARPGAPRETKAKPLLEPAATTGGKKRLLDDEGGETRSGCDGTPACPAVRVASRFSQRTVFEIIVCFGFAIDENLVSCSSMQCGSARRYLRDVDVMFKLKFEK